MKQNNIKISVPVIALLVVLFIVASVGCAANGYGCQGRSKIITRVR